MALRRYRPIALALLVLHLAACQTWRPTTVSPRQMLEEEQPTSIRVTLMSGEVVTLNDPRIANDSIEGVITGAFVDADDGLVAAVAARDVTSMEVRRFSAGRTFAAVVFGGAAALGIASLIFLASLPSCGSGGFGPCR